MKCINCELASECTLPDYFFGGCDIDGSDDIGCGEKPPFEEPEYEDIYDSTEW